MNEQFRGFAGVVVLCALISVPVARAQTFSAQEVAAVKSLQGRMDEGVPYELDLSDPEQYTYAMAMLHAAGVKPERRPQLFTLIEKQHSGGKGKGLRRARGWASVAPETTGMMSATDDSSFSPINVISYMNNSNNQSVTASLLSSVPGGTQSTQMMINYRMASSDQPFAASPDYEQYNAGTQFEQSYSANMPQSGSVIGSALFMYTVNNIPTMVSTWVADAAPNATDQCSTAPNYGLWQQPLPPDYIINCPPTGSACINKGSITTKIVECYGRNSSNPPCNYAWGGTGYPTSLLLNIAGTMTFPYPIHQPLTGLYSLYLQRQDQGGCVLTGPGGQLPAANFSIDPGNNKILNYCFTSAAFPSNPCMQTAWVNMYLNLNVGVQLDVGGAGSNYGQGTVSSNPSIDPHQPYFALIPIIQVLQGCVATGTRVTMASGKTKAIETIKGDGSESVLVHPDGQRVAVQGVANGTETHPMIRITDSFGNTVMVSQTHPVVVGDGNLVPAEDVKVGDSLVTRKGASKVTKIERVPYGGKVWNLTYGPVERYGIGRSTFFANGILVGNFAAQQEMRIAARNRASSKENVLAALPKEWHQDYLNWLAEQQESPKP